MEKEFNSKKYLECGKIINTHGINGVVKAESWCDSPEILASLEKVFVLENGKMKKYRIDGASVFKRFVLLELAGVTTIEDADKLRENVIYLERDDLELEEGEVFIADLIGLPVIDVDSGVEYGTLTDVINEAMMPAVKEFVKNIDLEKGIFIKPIEGMF